MSKLVFILFFFIWNATSQEITGFVYSNSSPVANVNILVKNLPIGTQSDKNGKFKLTVKKGDVIIFSHIGMQTKELKVKNFKTIKINLEAKINTLKEVKITSSKKNFKKEVYKPVSIQSAFGKISTRGISYAVHSIDGKDVQKFTVELPRALVGKIPNYTLSEKGVTLRKTGFKKKEYALWDIDGVVFEGLPPYVNPEEVESVHVITNSVGSFYKYGKRGRGGVIIVNTIKHKNIKKNKKLYPQLDFFQLKDFKVPNEKEFYKKNKGINNNLDSLRLLAFAYQNKGNFKLALNINRFLLANAPNDIKSYRDLSEVLLKMNEKNKSWNIYKMFLRRKGENVDNTSFNIIYHDMERLFHSYNLKETIGNTFISQKKSSKLYENETRIVFEWTVPNQSLSIEVINPKDQSVNFQIGGNFAKDSSIEEFFIDETFKGLWKVNLFVLGSTELKGYLKVTIYRNWISFNKTLPKVKFFRISKAIKHKYKLFELKM